MCDQTEKLERAGDPSDEELYAEAMAQHNANPVTVSLAELENEIGIDAEFNAITLAAFEEGRKMLEDPSIGVSYSNMEDLRNDLGI